MVKNKARCPYGHYYNADKYNECPICNQGIEPAPKNIPESHPGAYPITEPIFLTQQSEDFSWASPESTAASELQETSTQSQTQYSCDEQYADDSVIPTAASSLQAAVNAVISHNDSEDVKTLAMWNAPVGSEPVVGWLICVKGEYFGQSFSLKAGNNTVGRAVNMDVHLAQEGSVSRNKHCLITFDPNNQTFHIQQGESRGLTYLNGEIVMVPTEMKSKDRISVGEAEFLLIPLCVDGFRWDVYTGGETIA